MRLKILGCYAATPRIDSNSTSQVLEIHNKYFLIDCGEGTQIQLRKNKIKFSKINEIFISHLHGDHFYGLPGLITTFNLLGRNAPLHIFAPKGIKKSMEILLEVSASIPDYELIFHELSRHSSERIYENDEIEVYTIPLTHRVYTNGYLFKEKPKPRKLNIEKIKHYGIDRRYFQGIKEGEDFILKNGEMLPNRALTFDPAPLKSYAFCSDTAYATSICDIIRGVDTLYHESTFLEEHLNLAEKTKHSTAIQAARIAKKAEVKRLIIGHFSTRYKSTFQFKEEASQIFKAVELADDGKDFYL